MSEREFAVGTKAQLSRTIEDSDIALMAQITGDTNPIHLDEDYAKNTRFQGKIAHGLFSMGLISATLGTVLPGPGAIYLNQTLDFLLPIRPGETITAEVEITAWSPEKRLMTLKTQCTNAAGHPIATGQATLLVDQTEATT